MKKTPLLALLLLLLSAVAPAQNQQLFRFPFAKGDTTTKKSEEVKRQMLPPALVRTAEGPIRLRNQTLQQVVLPPQGEIVSTQGMDRPYKTFYKRDANQNIIEYYEQYVESLKPKYQLKCEYKTLTEEEYAGRVVTTFEEEINYENNSGRRTISTCDNKGMPLLEEHYSYDGGWVKNASMETVVNGNGVRTGIKMTGGATVSKAIFDALGRTQEIRFTQEGQNMFLQVVWGEDGLPSEILTNAMGADVPEGCAYKIKLRGCVRKGKDLNIWSLFPAFEAISGDEEMNINDRTLINAEITRVFVETGEALSDLWSLSYSYDPVNRRIVATRISNGPPITTEYNLEADGKGYTSKEYTDGGMDAQYEYYRYNSKGLLVDDYYNVVSKIDSQILFGYGKQYEYTNGESSQLVDKKSYAVNYNSGIMNKNLLSTETYNYTPWSEPPFVLEEKNLSISIRGKGICQFGRNRITDTYSGKIVKGANLDLILRPKMNSRFKSIKVNGVDKTSEIVFWGVLEKALRMTDITADQAVEIEFEPMTGTLHNVKVLIEGEGKILIDDVEMSNNTVIQVVDNGFIPYVIEEKYDDQYEQLTYLQQLSFAGTAIEPEGYASTFYLMPVTQGGDMKFVFLPNIDTRNTIVYVGEPAPKGIIESTDLNVPIDDRNQFSVKSAEAFRLRYNTHQNPTLAISKMEINNVEVTEKYLFRDNGDLLLKGMLTQPTNTITLTLEKVKKSSPTVKIYQPNDQYLTVLLNNEGHGFSSTEETFQFHNLEKTFRGWGVYLLFPQDAYNNSLQRITGVKVDNVDRFSEVREVRIYGQETTCLLLRELPEASFIQLYYDGVTSIKNLEIDATVYVQGNQLLVEGLEGNNTIELYDSNGRLLENRNSSARNERFVLPVKGLYLLKIGEATAKIQY